MPAVIRNRGTLRVARDVDGKEVTRSERILLGSDWLPCLDTDNHFIYKSKKLGSEILCTCGSPAITVGYQVYGTYSSYKGNEVIACKSLMMYGKHSDGST